MDLQSWTTCIAFAAVLIICYVVGNLFKASKMKDEFIPYIVALVGGLIAIPGMFIISDFPVHDLISAIAFGMFCGLAATGVNQWTKQLQKLKNSESSDKE